MGLKFETAE